jgi:hypothetical protein
MRPRFLVLASLTALPFVYWIVVSLKLPAAIGVIVGIALAVSPGYLWSYVLLGRNVRGLERPAVACGLTLIVPVLGGLVLYASGITLDRDTWAGLLTCVTIVGVVAIFLQRGDAASAEGQGRPRVQLSWRAAAYGLAAVMAVGALAVARIGVAEQKYPGFTQLWLSPEGKRADTLSLGVANHVGARARYRLVLFRENGLSATWNLTLADGQTWHRTVTSNGQEAISADLYKLPNLRRPYRFVTTNVEPEAP